MPNHVSINLTIIGKYSALNSFIKKHLIDIDTDPLRTVGNVQFDFNTIIPMPEALVGTTSPTPTDGDAFDKERRIAMRREFGFDNWYDWSIANWGTKWNSYECDCFNITMGEDAKTDDKEQAISFSFQTAWDLPRPIFDKLAEMYPNLTFHIECCDDGGFFAGETDIVNGEVQDQIVHNNEEHWQHWASIILGYSFDENGEIC